MVEEFVSWNNYSLIKYQFRVGISLARFRRSYFARDESSNINIVCSDALHLDSKARLAETKIFDVETRKATPGVHGQRGWRA
jgi:hypothetical protein